MINTVREKCGLDIGDVFTFEGTDYECWFSEEAFYLTDELQFSSSERESLKAKLLGWLVMGKPIKVVPFSPEFR